MNITTITGKVVDPLNLTSDDVDIRDIAGALSAREHWGGSPVKPRGFYSSAQHSVLTAKVLNNELVAKATEKMASDDLSELESAELTCVLWKKILKGLLHISWRAYVPDGAEIPWESKFKHQVDFHKAVLACVYRKFMLGSNMNDDKHVVDAAQRMTDFECAWVLETDRKVDVYSNLVAAADTGFWDPAAARREFLEFFKDVWWKYGMARQKYQKLKAEDF